MLFSNKGISLVVLLITITLISVLGASFVSLMSSKQKSFLHQIDSYRALNIANAGVEYAIRYIGDNIKANVSDPSYLSDFLHNSANYIPVVSTTPDTSNLKDGNQWRPFVFGAGNFYLSYYINPSLPDDYDNNKILYSVGTYKGSTRIVKLRKFLAYASSSSAGLGRLNLAPGISNKPFRAENYVHIPLIGIIPLRDSLNNPMPIASLQLQINFSSVTNNNLKYIYLSDIGSNYFQTRVYDFQSFPTDCVQLTDTLCKDGTLGVRIPDDGPISSPPFDFVSPYLIGDYSQRWCTLEFEQSGASLTGDYTIRYNLTGDFIDLRFIID